MKQLVFRHFDVHQQQTLKFLANNNIISISLHHSPGANVINGDDNNDNSQFDRL